MCHFSVWLCNNPHIIIIITLNDNSQNKGVCGLPESFDSKRALAYKLDKLVQLLQLSRHTVVLTGAGISTSAGIPDFRGPNGIWTKEMQEGRRKKRRQTKIMIQKRSLDDDTTTSICSNEYQVLVSAGGGCSGMMARVTLSTNDANATVVTKTINPLTNKLTNNGRRKRRQDDDGGCSNGAKLSQPPKSESAISFETALPTYTHWALAHMMFRTPPILLRKTTDDAEEDHEDGDNKSHKINPRNQNVVSAAATNTTTTTTPTTQTPTPLQYIVTQNIDGLHRKTNIPRNKMSILHGCSKFTP